MTTVETKSRLNKTSCNNDAMLYAEKRIKKTNRVKQKEIELIHELIRKNDTVLDLCSGPGTFLVPLTKEGFNIEGIEYSECMIGHAKNFASKEKAAIKIEQGDATRIKRKDSIFNSVLLLGDSIGSIQNFENRQRVFNECNRVIREGGIFIVTASNINASPLVWIKQKIRFIRNMMTYTREFERLPYELDGEKRMHHRYTEKGLRTALGKAGFSIERLIKIADKMIVVARK